MINDVFMANSFVADKFVADRFVADRFVADRFVDDRFVDVFCFQLKPSSAVRCELVSRDAARGLRC
jgi:hypothetical protein